MTSTQTTPSIALIAMLGNEIKRNGQNDQNLERIIARTDCPEWVIPAVVKLRARKIGWIDVLRVLDLPPTDGINLSTEEERFAGASPRALIAMVVTEIAASGMRTFPTPEEYRRMRSESAPSLIILALQRITWRAIHSRYEYQAYTKSQVTPTTLDLVDIPDSPPESAVQAAIDAITQETTSALTAPKSDLAKPTQTAAKMDAEPVKNKADDCKQPDTATKRIKAAIAKAPGPKPESQAAKPATWFQQQTAPTHETIQNTIIELMHTHKVFGPTDYQRKVTPEMGPQPGEVARAFASDFWFKVQDAYIAQYGAQNVPQSSTERNWRALPIEEVFKRMHDEAQTLGLTSEFAYNSKRRMELAPSSIIVRTLCQEQKLDYRQLRNRFFGQLENHFIDKPRNFATYPLEYVLNAFHEGLLETGAKTAAEYDRAYNRRRHPSLAQVERVAARNSLDVKAAYLHQFKEPEFPV